MVAAVARLTPTAIFGWATESFGSLAQNTLWAIVLIGVVGMGYWAGQIAGQFVRLGRLRTGVTGRLSAGFIMAAVLFLIIAAGIFPLAREGFFAAGSQSGHVAGPGGAVRRDLGRGLVGAHRGPGPPPQTVATPRLQMRACRVARRCGAWPRPDWRQGVAFLGWRLAKAPTTGDAAARRQAAAEIAARANRAAPSAPARSPRPRQGLSRQFVHRSPEPLTTPARAVGSKPGPAICRARGGGQADAGHYLGGGLLSRLQEHRRSGGRRRLLVADDRRQGRQAAELLLPGHRRPGQDQNITTLSCISNELNGDLAGTAEWTGLPLRDLLKEAGVDPAAVDIVFRAADGYDDSIPLAQAMHPTTLLVTGMNGEPLPPDHGFPARLIVPPIYGMKNVKWVQRIEAVDNDYQGYWQTRGWSDPAPYQIWGRIDTPASGEEIPAGPAVAAGVAAAGDRGIFRVEISLDEGATWADATLEPSINPDFTWVRWVFPFEATGRPRTS